MTQSERLIMDFKVPGFMWAIWAFNLAFITLFIWGSFELGSALIDYLRANS